MYTGCTVYGYKGDPWGGLLFELGYQAALLHLSQHVLDEATAYNRENPRSPLLKSGHVVAYEDDTQVMGPTPLMFRIALSLSPLLAEHGVSVNIHKSFITGQLIDSSPDQPEDFQLEPEGLMVLGVPTGTSHYRRAQADRILTGMAPPTAVLSLISPRTALHLLLQCYNPRPAYLLRTIANITDIDVSASLFDTSICEAVAAVLQTTPSKTRCYLPRKFGGLGLSRHHGMATEKSQILSH